MWNAQSHQIWQKSRPVAFNLASDKEFIREIGLASPEVVDRLEEERRKQSQNEELLRRQKRTPEQDQELGQSLYASSFPI